MGQFLLSCLWIPRQTPSNPTNHASSLGRIIHWDHLYKSFQYNVLFICAFQKTFQQEQKVCMLQRTQAICVPMEPCFHTCTETSLPPRFRYTLYSFLSLCVQGKWCVFVRSCVHVCGGQRSALSIVSQVSSALSSETLAESLPHRLGWWPWILRAPSASAFPALGL